MLLGIGFDEMGLGYIGLFDDLFDDFDQFGSDIELL